MWMRTSDLEVASNLNGVFHFFFGSRGTFLLMPALSLDRNANVLRGRLAGNLGKVTESSGIIIVGRHFFATPVGVEDPQSTDLTTLILPNH
jgi:hypothetical protein